MASDILLQLREALASQADEATRKNGERYFKSDQKSVIIMYGIRSATVTQIGKTFLQTLKHEEKHTIFGLCEDLWASGMMEESFIACQWSYSRKRDYTPDDFTVFERWVGRYVNNWASCDTLCNHTIGTLVEMYPAFINDLKRWAESPNRWLRRAAAVSLIVPARKGLFLREILEIATILLHDKDDMVQKGYGWMLKVASQQHLDAIFQFVLNHKATMPRTAGPVGSLRRLSPGSRSSRQIL
ncbi:MAG: DNA alkylation repair protein [Bacteroidales bacterium]